MMDFTISDQRVENHIPTPFYDSSKGSTALKISKFQVFFKLGNFIKLLIHRSSIDFLSNLEFLKYAFHPIIRMVSTFKESQIK